MSTSNAEAVESLQQELERVEDLIGAQAVRWRDAAANPAEVQRVAERLAALERQRDLLRDALGEHAGEIEQAEAQANAKRVQAEVDRVRAHVVSAVDRRLQLGRDLAGAVERLAKVVRALYEQGAELHALFSPGSAVFTLSGVCGATADINREDLQYVVNQVLAQRLGRNLWKTETSPASRDIDVADRVARECAAVVGSFDRGVALQQRAN